MKSNKILDEILLDLGHRENLNGTEFIRHAVAIYKPGMAITKELYPAIAKAAGSTPQRVERSMRHSIETAWTRGDYMTQERYFGYSVDPERGKPTVGEYVARLARICNEN